MKAIVATFIALFLTACGGGGGGSSTTSVTVPPGIYSGTVTPSGGTPDSAVGLITSNGKVAIVDVDTIEAFIGTISSGSLSGALYSSSTVPATGQVTSASGNNISGTYTSSLGGGTFALVADPNLYNRTSSLSKLVGTWVDSVFTNLTGTTTWVIQADGSFTVSSTASCTGSGNFTVFNSSNNEYNLTLDITNCPGFNGTYTGFAVVNDTYFTDDTISLIFSNGAHGGISEPIK
jgi:hypothetical protein